MHKTPWREEDVSKGAEGAGQCHFEVALSPSRSHSSWGRILIAGERKIPHPSARRWQGGSRPTSHTHLGSWKGYGANPPESHFHA